MKSDLETLNPTRVKLTVEVPFDELKPSLDAAYRKIGSQVTIPGFRKGKVPPRVIDQRFGREMVLAGAPDIPVWYSQPETGGSFGAITSAGGIFTGDLDAASFAKKVQASVKPNPKA